jgi:thiosulfate dehydrogenase (quinone) large subunit
MDYQQAPFARFLFENTKAAWLWLLARLYVGWIWLQAGWEKVNSPAWVGDEAGSALVGFLNRSLEKATSPRPDVSGWYASFLENIVMPHASGWSHLIAFGELMVGVALIIGAFTGIAAFFGLFMNFNFLLAGTVGSNPILFVLSIGIMLAWRVCGHWGLDRYLLPRLGTPWQPGPTFQRRAGD